MDWDPFADALKSVRKGSPNVKSLQHQPQQLNAMTVDPRPSDAKDPANTSPSIPGPVAISAKTGKPKKIVRFAGEGELEKVKWIERAVYEDDGSGGGPHLHGRSLADLQREEGSLLRHKMLEQVDWAPPAPIAFAGGQPRERGAESAERDVQALREASTLAALYQGAPPDTPVEPPALASLPMDLSDPNVVVMVPGDDVAVIMEMEMQTSSVAAVVVPQPSLQDLMAQLAGGSLGAATPAPTATATATVTAPAPSNEAGVGGNLAELLERLKGSLPTTADLYGSGGGSSSSSYGAVSSTGHGSYESTSASTNEYSSGVAGYGAQPPTGPAHDSYGGGNSSYGGYGAGGGQSSGYGDSGRPRGGQPARGRGNRGVPSSQNSRRPLCSFFAKGRSVPPSRFSFLLLQVLTRPSSQVPLW
jgi:protein phosphatase 1 regulatory subunit 10